MHYSAVALSLTAAVAAGVAFAQTNFTVNTPNIFLTCQPTRITWVGGQAPYFPRITAPGNTGDILRSFPQTSDTGVTWTTDLAAGQSVTIAVGDSAGNTAASSMVQINQGGSTSCVHAAGGTEGGSSSASSGGSSGSGSSSAAPSSSSASSSAGRSSSSASSPSSSSAASTPSSSAASTPSSSAASSPSASASTAPNGAESVRGFSAVVAGVVGVAAAALL